VAAALYAADSLNHGDAVRVGYDITAFDYETSVYFTRLLNFVNANSPSGGTAVKVEDDLITVACGQLAIAQGEQGLSTSQGLSMGFDCYGTLNTLADSSSGRRLVREAADQFSCIDVISGDGLSPAQPSLDSGDSECNASDAYSHNGYP
jgi:hypothetical protein